jgi:transcriptional regulator with XRE-family HTH domain
MLAPPHGRARMRILNGEIVEEWCRGNGVTFHELALKLGVQYNTLRHWLAGDATPSFENAQKLARVMDISVERLLMGGMYITNEAHSLLNPAALPQSPKRLRLLRPAKLVVLGCVVDVFEIEVDLHNPTYPKEYQYLGKVRYLQGVELEITKSHSRQVGVYK